MKIRLNGNIDLYKNSISFRNLDVELISDNEYECEEYNSELDFNELIVLDEYLNDLVEDYAEIIEYTDIDIREALISMIYELLD